MSVLGLESGTKMMKYVLLLALVAVLTVEGSGGEAEEFEPSPIGRCPPRLIPNKTPRLLPDRNDCSVYYECGEEGMTTLKCPQGKCFSRAKKGCD